MKHIKLFLAAALWLAIVTTIESCKKDDPAPQTGQAIFWTASKTLGGSFIDIIVDGQSAGQITVYPTNGVAPACGTSGYVTVTKAPGTYNWSATGQDGSKWNGTVTVSANSCFKMELTGPSTGQAMFWTNSDLGCGNITVTCNGVSGIVSSYYSSGAPACGAVGCFTAALNPGTYNFSASCSGKSWNGQVTVVAGGCFKMQLTN